MTLWVAELNEKTDPTHWQTLIHIKRAEVNLSTAKHWAVDSGLV